MSIPSLNSLLDPSYYFSASYYVFWYFSTLRKSFIYITWFHLIKVINTFYINLFSKVFILFYLVRILNLLITSWCISSAVLRFTEFSSASFFNASISCFTLSNSALLLSEFFYSSFNFRSLYDKYYWIFTDLLYLKQSSPITFYAFPNLLLGRFTSSFSDQFHCPQKTNSLISLHHFTTL
jgi:hypothetical protein